VPADGHEVDVAVAHINWHLAHGLSSVCMEEYPFLAAQSANLFHGLTL